LSHIIIAKNATGKNGIDPYLFPQEICGYVIISDMTYLFPTYNALIKPFNSSLHSPARRAPRETFSSRPSLNKVTTCFFSKFRSCFDMRQEPNIKSRIVSRNLFISVMHCNSRSSACREFQSANFRAKINRKQEFYEIAFYYILQSD